MESVNLLAIFAENKTGQLARVTDLLAKAHLNIHWVTIASTGSFGVIKLLVDDTGLAYQQLKHEGFPVSLVPVLALEVNDQPGGLAAVANDLAQQNINVQNASGFVSKSRAVLLIEIPDLSAARETLEKRGWRLLKGEEVLRF